MALNLLERLERSTIGKKLQADFEGETLAKRRKAADEIKRINAELTKALPALLQAREKAKANVEAAQEAFQKAKETYDRAYGDEHNVRVRADTRRHEQEIILHGCYPGELDKLKDEMNRLLDLTRSEGIRSSDHGHRSIIDDKWKPNFYSDSNAVHARLAYLLSAIRETEELKLQALEPEKLTARLQELRRKMPQSGVMQLVS